MEKPLYQLPDDDNDSLYRLPDDSDDTNNNDLCRHDNLEEEENDSGDEEEEDDVPYNEGVNMAASTEVPAKKPWVTGFMFRIMFNPVEGWKALKRARLATETVASKCFYPILALTAISEFAILWNGIDPTLNNAVVRAVTCFISFFFGYFVSILLSELILPKQSRGVLKTNFGKEFVMICMSTLALFKIFLNLLPMMSPVIVFLPLWTIYLIFKASKTLRVPKDSENSTTVMLCVLIIGAPLLFSWIMEKLLPSSAS